MNIAITVLMLMNLAFPTCCVYVYNNVSPQYLVVINHTFVFWKSAWGRVSVCSCVCLCACACLPACVRNTVNKQVNDLRVVVEGWVIILHYPSMMRGLTKLS